MKSFYKLRKIVERLNKVLYYMPLVCIFFIWAFSTGIISLSWFFSYEEILAWSENKSYDLIRLQEENSAEFEYSNYLLSRWISLGLLLCGLGLLIVIYQNKKIVMRKLEVFSHQVSRLYKDFFHTFKDNPIVLRNYLLLILPIAGWQIRNHLYFPFFGDDLASYVYFARNGPILTAIFYPIPNNHIFYNILSSLAATFIEDPLLSTRLVSFISFHLLLLVLFVYLYRNFSNKWVAYLAVVTCGFFFTSSIYSIMGRGYMLFTLMALLASVSLLQYVEKRSSVMFFVLTMASILGAYTIPTFLIPFISLMTTFFIFSYQQRDKRLLKDSIVCIVLVGLGVLLLYLPTFLFSGVDAIIANKYVSTDPRADFYTNAYPIAVAEVLSLMAGTNSRGWLIFLILGILSIPLLSKSHFQTRNWLILSISILSAIFLYTLLSRSFMPLRVLTYASFFVYISYAIVVAYWIERIKLGKWLYPVVMVLIPVLGWWQYQHTVYLSYLFPEKIHDVTRKFIDRIIYDGETAYISTELKYLHWYYIYRNEIADESIAVKNDPFKADLIFLTSEAKHLPNKGYELVETVKGIEYSPDYYIYERNP